jgi:hypothetical protein
MITVLACLGKKYEAPPEKQIKAKKDWGRGSSGRAHLASKRKTLSSDPGTTKRQCSSQKSFTKLS